MYIKVLVTPSSKKEKFETISGDSFSVNVKEPSERNLANKRVCELVARHFSLSTKNVRIISGHKSPKKVISIEENALS